jgi:hypothetical protein
MLIMIVRIVTLLIKKDTNNNDDKNDSRICESSSIQPKHKQGLWVLKSDGYGVSE